MAKDATGRNRLTINLLGRWAGQIVVIVSGFVVPRLIDDSLGAVALGIWDFGWSTVAYFRYMGFGLAAGLNRFVALYTAKNDVVNLKRSVSSTILIQMVVAAFVVLASFGVSIVVPSLFDEISPEQMEESRLVLIFLGCNLAVRMLFWPARGILTGNHMWTVTSAVTAAGDILVLIGMFAVLKTGGGLSELGMVVFGTAVMTELVRVIMAKRVYKHRLFDWGSVDKKTMWNLVVFGVKNSVASLPRIIVIQTSALCLAAVAGPAALAVYARPLALFSHADKLISLYALLLTPIAGSLQGLERNDELKEFLLSSLQASFAMTIPAVVLLAGFGDVVVELWMGPDYVRPWLAPLLGAAFLLPYAHRAAMRILVGVNSHGKVALWSLLLTAISLAIAVSVAFHVGWTAEVAALVVGFSLLAGPGVYTVVGACRRFDVSVGEYFSESLLRPVFCNLPFMFAVVAARLLDPQLTIIDAAIWSAISGLFVIILYWKYLVPNAIREKVLAKIGR